MNFSNTFNRVIAHKSKIDNNTKDYNDNLLKIQKYKEDLDITNQLFKTTELGYEYLSRLINKESEKFVKKLQELITLGLQSIFYDRPDYSCDIRIEGQSASMHLVYRDEEDGQVVSPNVRDGIGGGVRTCMGFIAQIFFINHYEAERIIFVDEGFSAIDSVYLPRFLQFIKELASSKGFKILLITHDDRILEYADRVYRISKGKSTLMKGIELEGEQDGGEDVVCQLS